MVQHYGTWVLVQHLWYIRKHGVVNLSDQVVPVRLLPCRLLAMHGKSTSCC